MKRLALALLLVAGSAWAQPVQFNFTKAPVQSFLQLLYGDVLRKPFVISPDLVTASRVVTLNVSVQPDKLQAFIQGFLNDQSIYAVERDGVIYLSLRSAQVQSESTHPVDSPLPPVPSTHLDTRPADLPEMKDVQPAAFRVYKTVRSTPSRLCDIVNKVFQSACTPSGSHALLSHQKHLDVVAALAHEVDVSVPLVDVSVTFVEVTGSRRDGFGLSLLASALGASVGVDLGVVNPASSFTFKSKSLSAVLDVLRADSRFRQVASPAGRVFSGQSFTIQVGDEVPTLSGQSRDSTGQVTSQVVYRPSGVMLTVTPTAINEGESSIVAASLDAQLSTFSRTESGVNGTPTLSRRQVKTDLSIQPGEVAVIGGLTSSRSIASSSGIFGATLSKREEDQTIDLVLLLSASVVQ